MSGINRVNSQTPAIQFQPQTLQAEQKPAQQNDAFAKLNEALQALEQALQSLSFGGGGQGGQKVGQDLGLASGSGGSLFGSFDDLFKGNSTFDQQPAQTTGTGGNGTSFLDAHGGGGGNAVHTTGLGDKKSGGGYGGTVDPSGNKWGL